MAAKQFELEDIGTISVSKRSGSRSLRLSIAASGQVRVTIPAWVPYKQGVDFARSRADWILQNIPEKPTQLAEGQRIGKAHRLRFDTAAIDAPIARLAGTEIRVIRPLGMSAGHTDVQQSAHRACIRALRQESESLLPQRLKLLAANHGFSYNAVRIRQLTGRWGSCDNHQDIVLNLFLMQLPWNLIDYVLLHELVHTRHLNHGSQFWSTFLTVEPSAKLLRTLIRRQKPVLTPA